MTEAWFRNPSHYSRELAEVRVARVVWHRGKLVRLGIDMKQHAELYFSGMDYRAMAIGPQGAIEVGPEDEMDDPRAVYPVWSYGDDFVHLEELLQHPVGDDEEVCSDKSTPVDERPVLGQDHRVIINEIPPVRSGPGKRVVRQLAELQREYPDAIIHVSGLYGYKTAFGLGFGACDVEPREDASRGKITLPMGKVINHEQSPKYAQWVTLMGFSVGDLSKPRNRCIFNIKSALWAGENYDSNVRFRVHNGPVNPSSAKPPTTRSYKSSLAKPKSGDKMLCDTCSLKPTCKYYREGAVCSVPDSQTAGLARAFGVRNADQIISGLNQLLSKQAERLERGMHNEEIFDELDPEVTKLANAIFSNGVKLAKLINPELADKGTRVGVFVNAGQGGVGAGTVSMADPRALTAGVVAALEAEGIPRDRITPRMIEAVLKNDGDALAASQVIDVEESGG